MQNTFQTSTQEQKENKKQDSNYPAWWKRFPESPWERHTLKGFHCEAAVPARTWGVARGTLTKPKLINVLLSAKPLGITSAPDRAGKALAIENKKWVYWNWYEKRGDRWEMQSSRFVNKHRCLIWSSFIDVGLLLNQEILSSQGTHMGKLKWYKVVLHHRERRDLEQSYWKYIQYFKENIILNWYRVSPQRRLVFRRVIIKAVAHERPLCRRGQERC